LKRKLPMYWSKRIIVGREKKNEICGPDFLLIGSNSILFELPQVHNKQYESGKQYVSWEAHKKTALPMVAHNGVKPQKSGE